MLKTQFLLPSAILDGHGALSIIDTLVWVLVPKSYDTTPATAADRMLSVSSARVAYPSR